MDYGHTSNTGNSADFGFAPNTPEAPATKNLATPENQEFGPASNNAIFSAPETPFEVSQETLSQTPESTHFVPEAAINEALNETVPNLGEIVKVSTPEPVKITTPYEALLITSEKDHISRATLHTVESLTNNLKNETPLNGFYDQIQQMRDDYLNNSFNRKRSN